MVQTWKMPPEAPSFVAQTIAAVPTAVLAFVGWVVALVAMARLANGCEDSFAWDCEKYLQAHWWALFFELFVLVAMGLLALTKSVDKARMLILVFLGMASVEMFDSADFLLQFEDLNLSFVRELEKGAERAAEAGAAGFIILTIANFAMMLMVGVQGIWSACKLRIRISQPQPTGSTPPSGVVVGFTQPPDAPLAVQSTTS